MPAFVRGEDDPAKLFDTSHFNRYLDNRMGVSPRGHVRANGVDVRWDEEGEGNCWEGAVSGSGVITSDPAVLPMCNPPAPFSPGNLDKQLPLFNCTTWSPENVDPPGCDWTQRPQRPRHHGG